MKKTKFLVLLCLVLSFSCNQEYENDAKQFSNLNNISVSNDFDWRMYKDINIIIKSASTNIIKITSTDGNTTYYSGYLSDHPEEKVITISLPAYVKKLLINSKEYKVNDNEILVNSLIKSTTNGYISLEKLLDYNPVWIRFENLVRIDDETFAAILVYPGNQNKTYACVLRKTENTFTVSDNYLIGTNTCDESEFVKLNENLYLLSYTDGDDITKGKIKLLRIENFNVELLDEIIFSDVQINTGEASFSQIGILNDNEFVLFYRDIVNSPGSGKSVFGVIENNKIILKDQTNQVFEENGIYYLYLKMIDPNSFLLVNREGNGTVHSRVGIINGNTIEYGQSIQFNNDDMGRSSLNLIGADKYIVSYYNGSWNTTGNTVFALQQYQGNSITPLSYYQINDLYTNYVYSIVFDNKFIVTAYFESFNNTHSSKISLHEFENNNFSLVETYNFGEYTGDVNFLKLGINSFVICYNSTLNFGTINTPPSGDDSDGDGIDNSNDAYPNDPERAFDNYYPAAGYGSLAFEDLHPGTGDYDFNDIVVDYRFHMVTNSSNEIVEITATFPVKASGAFLENGFGFNLPEADPAINSGISVTGSKLQNAYISLNNYGLENGQSHPTIIVFDNFFDVLPRMGNGVGVNTEKDGVFVGYDTVSINITTNEPFQLSDFSISKWNPFIIVDQNRNHEIHLPDYPPTDLNDDSYFGTMNDNSVPMIDRYYKTANNLPWGLDIPAEFKYPIEKSEITQAYLKFYEWAESDGELYNDWYINSDNSYKDDSKIYQIPN